VTLAETILLTAAAINMLMLTYIVILLVASEVLHRVNSGHKRQ
jgi:hypothetical protein